MRAETGCRMLQPSFDAGAAADLVARMADCGRMPVAGAVMYPYFSCVATCRLPSLAGAGTLVLPCLVDAVNGLAATADAFETMPAGPAGSHFLEAEIGAEAAARAAQKTVTHRLTRRLRTVALFDVRIETAGIVHKLFWIFDCGSYRVMVDSVTGGIHPLSARTP